MTTLHLLGYASGTAAAEGGCRNAPFVLQRSPYLSALTNEGIHLYWEDILEIGNKPSKVEKIAELCEALAERVYRLVLEQKFFVVFGGDHSSAIGTWSGASYSIKNKGSLGLIWIDAHMDSHTPETTPTGNIHGMPVACLLGQGPTQLTRILTAHPKIKPENLCLLGVRSFESGEAELLARLNVRVITMDEIKQRGLNEVMREAIHIASDKTAAFGISLDIDSIDPEDAPGTGVREEGGIRVQDLYQALHLMAHHPKLIGLEITEFDPEHDTKQMTEKLIPQLILSVIK
jgi:arginase